jgi:4-amino-4-deoxy-L-arabinose transferase-like glycosyltransferase
MQLRRLACLTLILLAAFFLRTIYLSVDRFHADEALYAGWALSILDHDPLLLDLPVDKPPLYLYALAGAFRLFGRSEVAARQLSLAASMLGIALIYRLARRIYTPAVGVWAALLLAFSPFDILFARTAFTDPMLTMWMLGALCTAVSGRWFWTGLLLGLAFATKQHAFLLVPLVLVAGVLNSIPNREWTRSGFGLLGRALLAVLRGFVPPFLAVMAWDAARWSTRPGFWQQSALSYGGLAWAPAAKWPERWLEWLAWARYLVGSPVLVLLVSLGGVLLFSVGWRSRPRKRETWLDTWWILYTLLYLGVHTVFQFSVWDRYLLPLAPLTALLLARAMAQFGALHHCPSVSWQKYKLAVRWLHGLLISLILALALFSGYQAARNGYPVGGEHWAYQGLDEIVAYLRENAPPDAVLYHHWLRWHYTYYLHGSTFELRWWESGEHMQREVLRTPDRVQYLVLPEWRTLDPDAPGLCFQLLYQARRRDSSVSLTLYRVTPCLLGLSLDGLL